eukprot:6461699-Pyramimonas_sp.AAC.1
MLLRRSCECTTLGRCASASRKHITQITTLLGCSRDVPAKLPGRSCECATWGRCANTRRKYIAQINYVNRVGSGIDTT